MVTRRTLLGGAAALAPLAATGAAHHKPDHPSRSVLIRGGYILTADPQLGALASGDVLVEGSQITQVAQDLGHVPGATVIDASDMIVAPGMVDNHRHLWTTLLRGASIDHTFNDYFGQILLGVQPQLLPEDLYDAGLLAAYEALEAGVTTVLDWNHGCATTDHAEHAVQALRDAGIRAVFGYGSPASDQTPAAAPTADQVADLHQDLASDPLVSLAMATRDPDFAFTPAEQQRIIDDVSLARQLEVPVSLHTGFTAGGSPAWLDGQGLLGTDTTLIHGNALTGADAQVIADAGAWVSSSPEVEMQMGLGAVPLRLLLDHGIAPTVSVDVVAAVTGDLGTQLRFILQTQRMLDQAAGQQTLLPAAQAVPYVMGNAAGSLGLAGTIGSLAPGKEADIILIDRHAHNLFLSPPEAAPLHAHPGNVDTVLVGGQIVKRHGSLVGVNLTGVRNRGKAARQRLGAA